MKATVNERIASALFCEHRSEVVLRSATTCLTNAIEEEVP